MGAADHHVDVQLGTVDHCVEVVAALGFFHVHIHSSGSVGSGVHVVTIHGTGQVVNLVFQITLNHAELVCGINSNACFGFLGNFGIFGLFRILTLKAVELSVEAFVFHLAGTHGGIVFVVAGAEPVIGAVDFSNQGTLLCVIGIDGGRCGLKGAVDVSAADHHIDIQLCTVNHCVEVVAALGFFHEHIHCGSDVGGGVHVVTIHGTGQVVNLVFQITLNHAELVCGINSNACFGFLGNFGIFGLFRILTLKAVELSVEAFVFHLAGTHGGIVFVVAGAEPVIGAVDFSNQGALLCVIGIDGGRCGLKGTIHMGTADHHIDVQLCTVNHGIEVIAALGFFHEHIHRSGGIHGGGHVVAAHFTGQIVGLVFQIALHHAELIGCIYSDLTHRMDLRCVGGVFLTAVIGGGMGNDPGILHLGYVAILTDDAVQGDRIAGNRLLGHTVVSGGAVGGPGTVNHNGAGAIGDVHVAIGGVVHLGDYTGDVVLTCGVGIVLLLLAHGNRFGNGQGGIGSRIGSFVGRLLVGQANQLAACAKFDGTVVVGKHTIDSNHIVDIQLVNAGALHAVALDGIAIGCHGDGDVAVVGIIGIVNGGDGAGQATGIGQGLAGLQGKGSLENFSRILRCLGRLTAAAFNGFQDTSLGKFNFAVVIGQGTGDGDGVANGQLVSALAFQAVALDGHILGTGNFDGNGDVLVAGIVHGIDADDLTGEGVSTVQGLTGLQRIGSLDGLDGFLINCGGNHMIPADRDFTAIGSDDGCGQHIGNGFGGLRNGFLIDVDGEGAVFVFHDFDELFVHIHGPYNGIGVGSDANLTQALVVHGSLLRGALVEHPQIFQSLVKLGISLRIGFIGFTGSSRFLGRLGILAFEQTAAGEHTQAHGKDQKQCKKFLHNSIPLFVSVW